MAATPLYLHFETRAAAVAALAPLGLVAVSETGEEAFVTTSWPDGTRVDLALVGGDGVYRRQTGTTTVEDPEFGPMETPIVEATPGFHVNLLWSDGPPPDFGTAVIDPLTPSQIFAV